MRLRYDGPDGQVNRDVARELGRATLEPGETISVTDGLGKRLLASSAHFSRAVASLDELSLRELQARAKDKGLEGYSKLSKDDLVAALRGGGDQAGETPGEE